MCRYVTVRTITQADVLDLHAEILSVFDADNIITPDQLRGNASSLKEALISDGSRWAVHPAIIARNIRPPGSALRALAASAYSAGEPAGCPASILKPERFAAATVSPNNGVADLVGQQSRRTGSH